MSTPSTTVAVLGQGSIGRRHAGLLLEAGATVRVHDPAVSAPPVPGTTLATSPEAALEGADAAVVASPTSAHLAQARLALEHDCHTLVEKPLSTDPAGVDDLLRLARERDRVLAVGFNLRFHPGPAQVRELVADGAIGRPLLAHVSFGSWLPGWRPQIDYRRSYSARAELGGGVLLDAIHELDYAGWVLGPATTAAAWMGRVSDLEMDVEDVALLTVAHEAGTLTTIELDYLDRAYRRGCRIVGSEASVEWNWERERIRVLGADGTRRELAAPSDVAPAYRRQTGAFLAAVRDGAIPAGSPLCDGEQGARAVVLADAARASHAADGRRVTLAALSPG